MCKKCCKGEVHEGMKDINRNRSTTDVLFFIIFLAFLGVVAICAILGASSGNAASLFFGVDYSGNTCGSANLNVPEATRKDLAAKVSVLLQTGPGSVLSLVKLYKFTLVFFFQGFLFIFFFFALTYLFLHTHSHLVLSSPFFSCSNLPFSPPSIFFPPPSCTLSTHVSVKI